MQTASAVFPVGDPRSHISGTLDLRAAACG